MPPTSSPNRPIKSEVDVQASLTTQGSSQTVTNTTFRTNRSPSNPSYTVGEPESSYRAGRSDAPPPSDYFDDSDPLIREIRMRPVDSPQLRPDETFSFHTSFQDVGKRVKACNDTLGELQALGVSHEVPLPELVLVGDQSAGKSSVMSGLADLSLPRSEGACTRCPLHIRVSHHSYWSCRVSLTKHYTFLPPPNRPITEDDVTPSDPFFPWRKLSAPQITEFKIVHDKKDLEDVLRWAQVAILNDHKPLGLFIPGSGSATRTPIAQAAEETVAKFSPNVVSLEIKGPGLPNLSFYDMPGIFQNPADAKDDYLVSVVRNLSSMYIKRPSAIIMCTMPMNSDAENSFTFGLIRKLQATRRTIGVLTKADLLPEGSNGNHDQWLAIMKGWAHQTGLGYFITSRPQGKDLEYLKEWEEAMFDNKSSDKWPLDFHQFQEQCGVERLKDCLSTRLGEEFVKCLPNIKHKVKTRLDKVNDELVCLPELPENVELEIQRSLMKFTDASRARIDQFVKHFNVLPANFRRCLLDIKPKFILKDKTDTPIIELLDSDSEADSAATNTPSSKRPASRPLGHTPSKKARGPIPMYSKPDDSDSGASRPAGNQLLPHPFHEFSKVGSGFRTIRQVREEIEKKTKAGFPGRFTDEVYEDLALEAIKPWNGPMTVFLRETISLLDKDLNEVLSEAFDQLKKRLVFTEAHRHLRAFLHECFQEAHNTASLLYKDETQRLLTFNAEAFAQCKADELNLLTRFRHQQRMQAQGLAPSNAKPLELWASMPQDKRREDERRRAADILKIGPDQFENELEVISFVRGYYKVAALRFADTVSQTIMCRMIPAIRENLSFYLGKELNILPGASVEVFERLMAEDADVAAKREWLKEEKDKFVKALTSIEALNTGVDSSSYLYADSVDTVREDVTMEEAGDDSDTGLFLV